MYLRRKVTYQAEYRPLVVQDVLMVSCTDRGVWLLIMTRVCDYGNNRVQKFTFDGRFVGKTCDVIKSPVYKTILKDGRLLVSTIGSGVWCVNM